MKTRTIDAVLLISTSIAFIVFSFFYIGEILAPCLLMLIMCLGVFFIQKIYERSNLRIMERCILDHIENFNCKLETEEANFFKALKESKGTYLFPSNRKIESLAQKVKKLISIREAISSCCQKWRMSPIWPMLN